MIKKNIFLVSFFIFLALILIGGYFLFYNNNYSDYVQDIKYKNLFIGEKEIKVEVADTPEKLAKGLSGRDYLKKDTGLWFIFEKPDSYAIWMKDMNFAIDVLWISENGKIFYIVEDMKPESYPKSFYPPEKAKYILEVNSGFVKENNIKIGNIVRN